ncbi:flavin monoamine oxidase family protein [Zafaria sp. Z1313]|uniref:flavin monoamine oxidase family protein n=1 Tax=unclassified Zafaria TaxID=2828765 RepID=UPI002E775FF5|nr:NAD(P)/FAD-dependent oxidoreductase [Zafaria sp. J156]MEE1619781.1 NAD(P)/FAD-dependent oxidoreductase [Zafaria sp. J156]
MATLHRDVVVIGAGPTGLTTARALSRAGRSVAVLEARDRVGGRTWTREIGGATLEIGGQWVSPDQTALLELLDELRLETYPRYREGASVFIAPGGTRHEYAGEDFPVARATLEAMERLTALLDRLAAETDPEHPWEHPQARELDSVSFHAWLRAHSDDEEACRNIGLFIAGGMLTKPAHTFSALQAVLMAASAGSFSNLVDDGFILDRRVKGTMQAVSQRMAEELGDDVFLSNPVLRLEWDEDGVTAHGADVVVRARQAVVAVPPNLYSRISYDPPLPRWQHLAHQHQSMGLVIKVHAVYPTPFWRAKSLSGTGFSPDGLVQEVYDNTLHGDTRGTLVGFVSDEKADAVFALDEHERRAAVLSSLAGFLGPEALDPEVYFESDFGSEEWTRGAYATSYDLGGLLRYGPRQHEAVGPLLFASSDLAGAGYQHVDGAVRMGRRTAERILAALPQPADVRS